MQYHHFGSCNSGDGSLDLVPVVVVGMGLLTMTFVVHVELFSLLH